MHASVVMELSEEKFATGMKLVVPGTVARPDFKKSCVFYFAHISGCTGYN